MTGKCALLHSRIVAVLPGAWIEIVDFSDEHAGHPEAVAGGESHFSLTVRSESFAGLSLPERHRIIHRALGNLAEIGVHALKIEAFSTTE
ncbi:MAG: BolA family transcriptional regulator [Betaproteobacteria bacterium]|nr:BolA family transcriptional regulator [Betaproteobacteria bacterium]